MSYGFRAGGNTKVRRQPKMNDDIVSALRRSMAGDDPQSMPRQRGSMPRTGLPAELGHRMPVNLSNGEFEFTPEQIYAIGLHTIAEMKHSGRPGFVEGTTQNRVTTSAEANANAKAGGSFLHSIPSFYSGFDALRNGDYGKATTDVLGGVSDTLKGYSDGLGNINSPTNKRIGAMGDFINAGLGLNNVVNDVRRGNYTQAIGDGVDTASNGVSAAGGWLGNAPEQLGVAKRYLDAAGAAKNMYNGYSDIKNGDLLKGGGEVIDGLVKGAGVLGKPASRYLSALQAGSEALSSGTNFANGDYAGGFSHLLLTF